MIKKCYEQEAEKTIRDVLSCDGDLTIALVADADCRLLLELRYLSMKRWEYIAGEMQMCRTSVYLLHRRALDMVETILRTREECARHDAQ